MSKNGQWHIAGFLCEFECFLCVFQVPAEIWFWTWTDWADERDQRPAGSSPWCQRGCHQTDHWARAGAVWGHRIWWVLFINIYTHTHSEFEIVLRCCVFSSSQRSRTSSTQSIWKHSGSWSPLTSCGFNFCIWNEQRPKLPNVWFLTECDHAEDQISLLLLSRYLESNHRIRRQNFLFCSINYSVWRGVHASSFLFVMNSICPANVIFSQYGSPGCVYYKQ